MNHNSIVDSYSFCQRHIGIDDNQRQLMLNALGYKNKEDFMAAVLPASIDSPPNSDDSDLLAKALTENDALAILKNKASANQCWRSYLGQGYYACHTPEVIKRNVLENPAWYTAYTPYQAEISQGRLEVLLTFQTMVAELCAMDIANASLLDEASAAAEAMMLCHRLNKTEADTFLIDRDCFPQTIAVVHTRAYHLGIKIVVADVATHTMDNCFGVLLQYPSFSGTLLDGAKLTARAHNAGCFVVVASDLLSLLLLRPPGAWGADVVVGSTQRFGMPLAAGGPHAAFIATLEANRRELPGRLVGISRDCHGKTAYRLALQTREQHIRREKATSNICTAQTLPALVATFYAIYHGADGLRAIAQRTHNLCCVLAQGIKIMGLKLSSDIFFDTLTISTKEHTDTVMAIAAKMQINLRVMKTQGLIAIAIDETVTLADINSLLGIFAEALNKDLPDVEALQQQLAQVIPIKWIREDKPLQHLVFSEYRSETALMRYMRCLADRDLALDRTMIPLGSCTMKLNAAVEMAAISWPEFANIHPYAPIEQRLGYKDLVDEMEAMLCALTGFSAVSFQPNAGSQGEYAGLLAIKSFHASRGEAHRQICLIPTSAHGTNPASAKMCGFESQSVICDDNGNVDIIAFNNKLKECGNNVAAVMLTYPSTHGIFEPDIVALCDAAHKVGALVYIDGANFNAMAGLCRPGLFGGDVCHLNLHKSFCIPHGGGGPGVGPVLLGEKLKAFVPNDPNAIDCKYDGKQVGAISSSIWGNALVLPISWMYMRLMGMKGLRQASETAILNANYMTKYLSEYYPILFRGEHGLVAHECIVDMRLMEKKTGVNAEDVAKRLIDYGFHAPTMSFPVAGTLMIEPTESESKAEIDRFCNAMIAIAKEIAEIQATIDKNTPDFNNDIKTNNLLKNAPHTANSLLIEDWCYPYSRHQAACITQCGSGNKYWPPVGRVDNVYGDRQVVCRLPDSPRSV